MITTKKICLKELADVLSGVYERPGPVGEVAYLQTKDCADTVVVKRASRVQLTPRVQKNLLRPGDVLFAAKGVNYLSVVFGGPDRAVASTSFFVIRLRSQAVTPRFLCWFLRHPSVMAYFKAHQAGSATPLIHKSAVENLVVPVPPLEQQQTIVELARLSRRARELQMQIIEKREILMQQLLMDKIK